MYDDGGFILEGGGRAVLLRGDFGRSSQELGPLAEALRHGGFTVNAPAVFEPGEDWTAWLREAREAFMRLRDTHVSVSLCGLGAGIDLALMLAEFCPVDRLLLAPRLASPMPTRARLSLRALERRAARSLFALTEEPVILLDETAQGTAPREARRLSRMLGRCVIMGFRDSLALAALRQLNAANAPGEAHAD